MNLSQLIKLKNKNLILENPNGDPLGIITTRDITLSPRFNSIGSITFTVDRENCEVYDLITTGRTVLLQDVGRYIIENPSETSSGLSDSKTLTCRSFEYDINRKTIPYLSGTFKFYSLNSNDDTIVKRIFSYLPNWTLESVDSSLWNLYRTFDFTDRPLLQAMQEDFSNAFECVFVYNTLDSTIRIISYENVIKSSDIYLSFENLVKTLEITEKTDEIITSLSVFGGNDLSINLVNPLGNTIYDFSYFTDTVINGTKFMSDSLIDAIDAWELKVEGYQTSYANYLTQRKTKIAERVALEADLVTLKGELKALISVRDALLESNQSATIANTNVTVKQNQINAKELAITTKQNEIDTIEDDITDIQNEVSIQANFSANQIRELDRFIYNQSVTDENFVAGENDSDDIIQQTAQDLYDKYKKLLSKNKDIKYEFAIDLENFISQSQYNLFTSQLAWGVEVTLKNSRGELSYPILLGLDIPLDDENANVEFLFSTSMRLKNANEEYNDYLTNVNNTVNKVAGSNLSWGSFVNSGAKDKISDLFANGLNLDNQEVKSATGQEIIFDSTGLLGRKVVDGVVQQRQWKFINNKLLFTDDNWQTAQMAVGEIHLPDNSLAYGVSADVIFGKLGRFVQLEANQVYVGDSDLVEYIDNLDFDGDKYVEKDKLYNMTKISTEGGIQVFDAGGRERVQIGNYTLGKYGIEIKDKSGSTTVLDETGILQTWQEANVDNVDANNPLKLSIYLPKYTNVVNKAVLRFKREKFRAYSKSIESGGAVVDSSTASDIVVAVVGLATDVDEQMVNTSWELSGDNNHAHQFMKTIHHKHAIEIDEHSHEINIPAHQHGIEYGIYESTMPTDIKVVINGVDYSTYLGASGGKFNTDQPELDITSLLEIGMWNEVSLQSTSLGRIDASVFIQAFIQTVRKSIITDKYFVSNSEIGRANSLGRTSSVIIRTDFTKPAQGLYRFSLEGSKGFLYYTDLNTKVTSTLPRYEVSNIKNLSLAVDGRWIYDEDKNGYLLMTNSEPYMFWVDNSNKLYVKELDSIQEPYLLAENVTYVSSIRAWKNISVTTADHGILAVYIKSDGLVYYRNYTEQSLGMFSWEEERQITEFVGTAVRVSLFNTNDYRTGIFIEDINGNNRYLLTTRNWAGMAIPAEKIMANPYQIYLDLIELDYENCYEDIHLQANPYDIKLDLLFGSTENSILSAENKPIVMLDENEEEYDDWGWIIEFEVQNPIPELLLENIVVTDTSNSSTILMVSIENLGDNKYRLTASNVIESGFNNVLGDIKIDITNAINEAGYTYENMSYTFTPMNLEPTDIPIPEVVEVWNE